MRLLCVGRHAYLSEHLCRYFRGLGADCAGAVGAADALAVASRHEPHVVVCDCDLITPALLDEAAMLYHGQKAGLDQAQIREALDPGRFIAARTIRGGPAPSESLRQADHFAQGLAADEQTVAGIEQRLADSARKLESAIDSIIGGAR